MEPVEHDGKFLVIHPVTRKGHISGPGRSILAEMALPGFLEKREDFIRTAQRVKNRPIVDILNRIVGSVVAAPALDAGEKSAIVEIARVECLARAGIGTQQLALEKRPARRRHRRFDSYFGLLGVGSTTDAPGRGRKRESHRRGRYPAKAPRLHCAVPFIWRRTITAEPRVSTVEPQKSNIARA